MLQRRSSIPKWLNVIYGDTDAVARTRQVLAFTYPRDRWYVRTMFALGNFWLRLTGKKFRAFVHGPERMAAILESAGLVRATRRETLVWMLDLYHRGGARL